MGDNVLKNMCKQEEQPIPDLGGGGGGRGTSYFQGSPTFLLACDLLHNKCLIESNLTGKRYDQQQKFALLEKILTLTNSDFCLFPTTHFSNSKSGARNNPQHISVSLPFKETLGELHGGFLRSAASSSIALQPWLCMWKCSKAAEESLVLLALFS